MTIQTRRNLSLIVFGLVLSLAIVRGFNVSITYDESYSIGIAHLSKNPILANNHPLNTLFLAFMWLSPIDGHELLFRMLSITALCLYAVAAMKILVLVRSQLVWVFALSLFALNPFLLEYWSLARGYALASAATLWIAWIMVRSGGGVQRRANRRFFHLPPIAIWGLVCFYSSLSTLPFVVSAWLIYALTCSSPLGSLKFYRPNDVLRALTPYFFSIVLLIPGIIWSLLLQSRELLYFSGDLDPIRDTTFTVVTASLSHLTSNSDFYWFVTILIVILTLLAFVWVLGRNHLGQPSRAKNLAYAIMTWVSMLVALNTILGAGYPISRTALPFLGPIIVLWAISADEFFQSDLRPRSRDGLVKSICSKVPLFTSSLIRVSIVLLIALSSLSFVAWFNLDKFGTGRFDYSSKEASASIIEATNGVGIWCGTAEPLVAISFYLESSGASLPTPRADCEERFTGPMYFAIPTDEPPIDLPQDTILLGDYSASGYKLYLIRN